MSKLGGAIALAAHWHANQVDYRGEPYFLHPLRIRNAIEQAGYGENHQLVAIFHDLLEDTYCPAQELAPFGAEIEEAVQAISRRFELPVEPGSRSVDREGARLWGAPRETHWDYFLRCVNNPIARVVKYYDTMDNMSPGRFHPQAPYSRYIKIMNWYEVNGVQTRNSD